MKKIIVALICTSAIYAHAASIQWSMTSIPASPDTARAAGWVAYFMDSTTYTAFSKLNADSVANYATKNKLFEGVTKANRGQIQINNSSGNYEKGESISGYIILFDASEVASAKNYAYTSVKSGTVGDAGAAVILNFGAFSSATSDTGGWTAIPEPTSGLLMLLGAAGLALKRKRV